MRRGWGLALIALLTGGACVTPAPVAPRTIDHAVLGQPGKSTPEISTDDLRVILRDGSAVVFDVRPSLEFAMSHIPGAVNVAPKAGLAMSQFTSDVTAIEKVVGGDRSRRIVLYCNGPWCGKSGRVAEDLVAAGFSNVARYQLGIPTWRALGGVCVIEAEGVALVYTRDRTAVFVDARERKSGAAPLLPGASRVPPDEIAKAKDDGRLPMEDHNTRLIVFSDSGAAARRVAEEIAHNAFHNVSYWDGDAASLIASLRR